LANSNNSIITDDDDDLTEPTIQRMIEGIQKTINLHHSTTTTNNNNNDSHGGGGIAMSSVMKGHFELEIETLQNAPRDADKLRQLLKSKERQYEEATHIEDTQRLVTEIEMLKVVFCIW
jgi:methyl coenzyme M reductase beta subunit